MEVAVECPVGGEHTQTGVNGSEKKEGNLATVSRSTRLTVEPLYSKHLGTLIICFLF